MENFTTTTYIVSAIIQNNCFVLDVTPETREIQHHINQISLSSDMPTDYWEIKWNQSFNFLDVWNEVRDKHHVMDLYQVIWHKSNAKKMSMCAYKAISKRLPIADN